MRRGIHVSFTNKLAAMGYTCFCLLACLYDCLFLCLFVCVFVCLYVCMFACMFERLFICLLVCLFLNHTNHDGCGHGCRKWVPAANNHMY